MAYKLIVSPRAQKEIENAIDFYTWNSSSAPKRFIEHLGTTYIALESNPFFEIVYKNIRAVKIKKFPYSIYFVINEKQNTVKIIACFHHKRNPNNRPRN